jgi:endonuclease IV
MQSPRFRKIPKVLETPKGKDLAEDVINLKTLRTLVRTKQRQQRRHLISRIVKGY